MDPDSAPQVIRISLPGDRSILAGLFRRRRIRACHGARRTPVHHGRRASAPLFPRSTRTHSVALGHRLLDGRADSRLVHEHARQDGEVAPVVMFGVLLASYAINAMDRQLFPLLAPEVRREYGFSLAGIGL